MQGYSIQNVPSLVTTWFGTGVASLTEGTDSDQHSIATRASQLTVLLLAEEQSPGNIPFLDGQTYANFPKMLIPRFLSPDKITSQTNLNLLSVRYGLQAAEDVRNTTIAWNLVPEAYANFGYLGVLFAGLAFGLLTGLLTWIVADAPPISLRGLIGLTSLVTLIDVEYDFSYLFLNLIQAIISITVFFVIVRGLDSPPTKSLPGTPQPRMLRFLAKRRV